MAAAAAAAHLSRAPSRSPGGGALSRDPPSEPPERPAKCLRGGPKRARDTHRGEPRRGLAPAGASSARRGAKGLTQGGWGWKGGERLPLKYRTRLLSRAHPGVRSLPRPPLQDCAEEEGAFPRPWHPRKGEGAFLWIRRKAGGALGWWRPLRDGDRETSAPDFGDGGGATTAGGGMVASGWVFFREACSLINPLKM